MEEERQTEIERVNASIWKLIQMQLFCTHYEQKGVAQLQQIEAQPCRSHGSTLPEQKATVFSTQHSLKYLQAQQDKWL